MYVIFKLDVIDCPSSILRHPILYTIQHCITDRSRDFIDYFQGIGMVSAQDFLGFSFDWWNIHDTSVS